MLGLPTLPLLASVLRRQAIISAVLLLSLHVQYPMPIELQGQLEKITFRDDNSHFTIAKLKISSQRDLVTVVGSLLSAVPGETLRLQGTWELHPKFGRQFRFVIYETVMPATAKGIERYLGSGMIKGIGPVMAKRLVERFGTDTLEIIEKDIGRLREVEGIGEKRIEMISAAWAEQRDIREVMLFLQGHEVSTAYAVKIYRQYGRDAIRLVRENPYRLAEEIFGIGFRTADGIAEKLGMPKDSEVRAEAGILYVLRQFSDEGHVCYPREKLAEECEKILDLDSEKIRKAMEKVLGAGKAISEIVPFDQDGRTEALFLPELHASERGIAHGLTRLMRTPGNLLKIDPGKAVSGVERELGIALSENQKKAVAESVEHKIMVITGGPGTGKTTITRAIIRIYQGSGRKVLLAAPTGRAAKRLAEATRGEAKTIHRLLEFSPKRGGFQRNAEMPLEGDLLIVDESSMVDTILMNHLLSAVPDKATLILVGDVDQLPSVGAGNVLRDVIESGSVPTVRLTEIFRQSRESLIILNAHRVNQGEFPVLGQEDNGARDFYFFPAEEPEKAAELILDICEKRIPEKFGLHPLRDIQVLTPMHRGVVGTVNLNAELQRRLNPSGEEFLRGGRMFRRGDKVMQIRNNYDKEVFNGDIGRITAIDRENHELAVDYDGRPVAYDFQELDEVVLAYAVSVHKSQGSEYPAVVLPLLTQHYLLLQRNLLYTAITRGKRLVVIVGTKKALAIAIRNNKPRMRYTALRQRLSALSPLSPVR